MMMMVLILITHFEISYLYSKCPPGRNDKPNRILFWQSDPPCGRRPNVRSSICPSVLKNVLFISISIPLEGNVENVQSGPVLTIGFLDAMTDRTCTWNFPSPDRKLSTLWGIFLSGESCLVLSTGISRSATTPHEGNRRGSPFRDRGSTNPSSCLTESLDAGHYVGLLIRQCSLRVTVS